MLIDKENIVLALFNQAISGALIHNATRFAEVTVSPEITALLARNPEGDELRHLNRLLLEAAYPNDIAPFAGREWATIHVGPGHWLGVRKNGSLWTQVIFSPSTSRVGAASDWKDVAAGNQVSAAIKTDGTLWTWGDYSKGLLGNPSLLMPRSIGNSANWIVAP